jgi:NADH-quinone oxidoreductase subunit L
MMHLVSHAFFKACLFLSAGSIIHVLHHAQHHSKDPFDVQDIRNLGGLRKKLPFTFIAFVICGSALSGIPFTSGFLSKEAIFSAIQYWAGTELSWRWLVLAAAFIVSLLTVLYTFRMIWFVFMGHEKATRNLSFVEAPMVMRMPIAILIVASGWFIISLNPVNYMGWVYEQVNTGNYFHSPFMDIVSALWIVASLAIAYFIFRKGIYKENRLLNHAFYLDSFYTWVAEKTSLTVAAASSKVDTKIIDGAIHTAAYVHVTASHLMAWFDRAIVDGTVHLMAATAQGVGNIARSFQGGKVQLYIFWAAVGLIIFLIWILV